MIQRIIVFLTILTIAAGTASAQDDYRQAATAAARELSQQLDFLQRALLTIPGPAAGRGFYGQLDPIQNDLVYFQQQLKRPEVSREALYIAFDKMDGKLHQLLKDMANFEKWTPALQMVATRVQSADHDLHFALSGGDANSKQSGQAGRRQTLVLTARAENLDNMVRYVFADREPFNAWVADLSPLRKAITRFLELQDKGAAASEVKEQFTVTLKAWEKVVNRVAQMPQGLNTIIRSDAAQVDQTMFRLAAMQGVQIPRPPLVDPLAF